MAAIIVAFTVLVIVGLSLWYLVQPQPLLVQGEVDATRVDIAARIDGRVGQGPISRGDNRYRHFPPVTCVPVLIRRLRISARSEFVRSVPPS
jgi:hypothetical protein